MQFHTHCEVLWAVPCAEFVLVKWSLSLGALLSEMSVTPSDCAEVDTGIIPR